MKQLGALRPKNKVKRSVTVKESLEILIQEDRKLVNQEDVILKLPLSADPELIFIDEFVNHV